MVKSLWLICGVLLVALVIVIAQQLNLYNFKAVSGAKTTLPEIGKEELARPPQKKADAKNPNINAKSAILIDKASFQKLYGKNDDTQVPIASTTKIMTALVVLEDYPTKMNDVVNITRDMISVEGSDAQLRAGEKMTVENLLKGTLIVSGNDAAYTLAYYLGGKDSFVQKMNDKANFIGLKDTFYKDPAGLNDEGRSTAENLAIEATYALRNKTFADIVRTPRSTIASTDGRLIHELQNSNRMLRNEEQFYYPFAIGIKTGFTNEAGHCLVSAASKDGHELVAVILNTDQNTLTASAQESRKLLDWGFSNWTWN